MSMPSGQPRDLTMEHSCYLDLMTAPKQRRTLQKRVAQRVARNRMLKSNRNDVAEDGSNVVHRNQQQADFLHNSFQDYSQVEFLDAHNLVLAGDSRGSIDIVRLPQYHSPSSFDYNGDDENLASPRRRRHRPHGKLLAKKVDVKETQHSWQTGGDYRLKSLDRGHAFAIGYASGEFALFGTERASGLIRKNATQDAYQQSSQIALQYGIFDSLNDTLMMRQDVESLEPLLNNSQGTGGDGGRLPLPGTLGTNALWDFHETPSSLLSAFVQRTQNIVRVNVMDHRTSTSSPPHSDLSFCPDPKKDRDQIVSTCFVSDHVVSTLHLWNKPGKDHAIKIWDLRHTSTNDSCPLMATSIQGFDGSGEIDLVSTATAHARLTASKDDNGHVMATMANGLGTLDNYLVDTTRQSPVKRWTTCISKEATNIIYAISPTLDCLASYYGQGTNLSLFNMSVEESLEQRGSKRSRDDKLVHDVQLIDTINPNIRDIEGIRARLQCLAFNDTGTSLVGGTDAGDLFLWRGG